MSMKSVKEKKVKILKENKKERRMEETTGDRERKMKIVLKLQIKFVFLVPVVARKILFAARNFRICWKTDWSICSHKSCIISASK